MKTILAVDDDKDILESLRIILSEEGYKMHVASDADSAERALQQIHPDLVLLDIRLPDIPGTEIAKKIKSSQKTHNIPVIILSANYNAEDLSHKSGADAFLEKPFDITSLTHTVQRYIQ